ncbi:MULTISPECIES: phage antirepressor KilAC domain-containing protein [Gammaproteobacteria]|uniref:phage antirepressor KilAC domain-containing protein n=1 Tax=Gammaproteobacteria TaxID=1236 RepID=UPI0019114F54|nr:MULTISPECIES: phage antirepressor KilAC domain-containing protein [Gammaproteobacteria]MBK5299754.1 phage antirepressor KilAC domain-containing protein [Bacillus sp. TH86]MBK5319523.1 phage antirepressor KilAC domain-containing protein [Bacillus sp. TH59]MBK5334473.1 phage antirepressor KilAC domain-containing protein [Bacillus sp. TH57]MBK5308562.1 phage antirepressor KilAC domain-containing protein [Pseudomonas sp. TH71]MBK5314022.1 phage antirepressor KilAC domain-containing protein [Erw
MNRTLDQTAALLGVKPRALRKALRELRILTPGGDLASHHRDSGHLFSDPRSVQVGPKRLKHYAVVMVTETGIQWLAKKLGIVITDQEVAA